ncbi:MAG: glycerol-3-phosphate dehydrogenase/oxidase [Chloroflexota bacterium]
MKLATRAELQGRTHDVLIVGAGIVGCGIARDLALRGLSVALVDADDIGSGTTSRSTRLIHGGLRYLEMLDFGLVREDMREREVLLRIAPHLVKPLPFLVPMYRWPAWKRDRLRLGMILYDLLSYDKSLPWHRFLSRAETLAAEPALNPEGLQGAARYYDCQVEFPERLALANALDAARHGGLIRTYTRAEGFVVEDGAVKGVRATTVGETAPYEIRARLTVNASGPWLDGTLTGVPDVRGPLLRRTKGVHLVMAPTTRNAILLLAARDGRVFFLVPWNGYSLVGTTDTDFVDDPSRARAESDDVRYLVREAAAAFPSLARAQIHLGMAGVRALVRKEGVREGQVSRKHAVREHARQGGPPGLLSVLGGKITAYRDIAEEVGTLVAARLGVRARCITSSAPLPGGESPPESVERGLSARGAQAGVSIEAIRYLVGLHGTHASDVLDLVDRDPALAAPIGSGSPAIAAQVIHAVREEGAISLADVLLRRVPLGLGSGGAVPLAARVAELMSETLGWTATDRGNAEARYAAEIQERYQAPT